MCGDRTMDGVWEGAYAYDDRAFARGADSFTWTIQADRRGGLEGSGIDGSTRRPAELAGRVRGSSVEIVKSYDPDPDKLLVVGADGILIPATQHFATREWREHIAALYRARGGRFSTEAITVERLARDFARGACRIEYSGGVVTPDRMEGRWRIPGFVLACADVPVPEVSGTWWAERRR